MGAVVVRLAEALVVLQAPSGGGLAVSGLHPPAHIKPRPQ